MLVAGIVILGFTLIMGIYIMTSYRRFSFLSSYEISEYKRISNKQKEKRSKDEQEYFLDRQEAYIGLIIVKISFLLSILCLVIGFLQTYILN